MPLYEYECDTCGHRFEVIQKFSDEPLTECPKCRGAVRKLVSSPAIQFKGSGWYITDYARKGGSGGSSGAKGETSADKGASASGDSSAKADTSSTPSSPAKPSTPPTKS